MSESKKAVPDFNHLLKDGWFSEKNSQWPGQALSLEIDGVLFNEKSEYQHVMVLKSKHWGNVLILDGVIQLTTRDESSYQEMITHLPMYSHANPENVLIVGGGDGGVVREVVKHPCVKNIHICEIDKMVIECGKKFFPSVASAWDDKRVKLITEDAAKYVASKDVANTYDVIIVDSSDPDGPAEVLFEEPFFVNMEKALKAGGRISTQAESIWLHLPLIKKLLTSCSSLFAAAEYATTQIPTYPCGQIGFLLLSKASAKKSRAKPTSIKPTRRPSLEEQTQFTYYTPELHSAAFVLPAFVQRTIDAIGSKEEADKDSKPTKPKRKPQPASKSGMRKPKKADSDEDDDSYKPTKVKRKPQPASKSGMKKPKKADSDEDDES